MIDIPGFVIAGAPRSKKTSQKIVTIPTKGSRRCAVCGQIKGFKKILPSDAHEEWHDQAMPQLALMKTKLAARGVILPITGLVNVEAIFYQDVMRADAVGLYEGLGDILQDAGIIENDKQIESWDGSRRRKDKARPRIEVYLTVLESADPVQEELPMAAEQP